MRKSKFSPQQIASILKEFDNGKSVTDITREHGVSAKNGQSEPLKKSFQTML